MTAIYRLESLDHVLSLDGWLRIANGVQINLPDLLLREPLELAPRASAVPPPRYFSGPEFDRITLQRRFLELFARNPRLTLNMAALKLNISTVRILDLCPKEGRILIARRKAALRKARLSVISKGIGTLVSRLKKNPETTQGDLFRLASKFRFGPKAQALIDDARRIVKEEKSSERARKELQAPRDSRRHRTTITAL